MGSNGPTLPFNNTTTEFFELTATETAYNNIQQNSCYAKLKLSARDWLRRHRHLIFLLIRI